MVKKKKQINKSKRKTSLGKISLKKTIISNLDNFDKRKLLISILAIIKLKPKTKNIDIAIIYANTYYIACYLKKTQIFAISIKDIQY